MAIVVSGGDVTALQRGWSPQWPAASTVRLFDDRFADYAAIYRTQPAVRKCVGFLARNIAELGLHVFRRVSDTDRTRLNDHPLAVLLARPNGWTTRYRLMDALICDLGIYDEAFWLKWRDGSTPALIRIPPTKVAVQGSWLEPTGFTIYGATGKIDVDRSQMVFFRGYNPDPDLMTLRGLSPLETLRRVLAEDDAMGDYRERLWRSGARFEGVLTRPVDAPRMSPEAKDRFWARWNASHTGSTATGSTALLEEGMAYAQTSFSAKDSQYQESRRLNDEEVAAAYHIPLPMVGHLENATFSNISEQHKNLYQDTLGPRLEELVEEIELQLLPDFADTADVYCEFNLEAKLRGSFEEQAAALQASVGGPWVTRNEARARTNLPSVDGGDDLITPLNVVTGGQASPQDSVPPSRALALVDSLSKEMAQ